MQAEGVLVHVPQSIVAVASLLNSLPQDPCALHSRLLWLAGGKGDRGLFPVPTFPDSLSELHGNL